MIQINSIDRAEFPKEDVLQCKGHFNQVYRKRQTTRMLRASAAEPTLLEVEEPKPFALYDVFEIQDFTFSRQTQTGHFKIQMSFKETFREMEISGQLLNMETEEVLAQIPAHQHSGEALFTVEEDFTIREKITSRSGEVRLGLIARGKWGNGSVIENELSVFKEANSAEEDYQYNHVWPKIEDSVVILGNIEHLPGKPQVKRNGSKEHIVIALIRKPDDMSDVDYLCGYGRDYRHASHPYLCVPGQGEIIFSANEMPKEDEEHRNYAICKLYRKGGKNGCGAFVIAGTPAYYLENKITIKPLGNGYHYQFVSWDTSYEDKGDWQKTEFDYHLEMVVHTVDKRNPKRWHMHKLVVSTLEGVSSFTDEIRPLYIMYGCVAPWTKIRMADGKEKEIQNIQIGEFVIGRNGEKLEVCNVWRGKEDRRMLSLTVEGKEDDELLMTKDHPVLIQTENGEEKWKMAKDCRVGERVLVREENMESWRGIQNITEKEPCEEVWNLEVKASGQEAEKGMAMFTDGILTGDYVMQNALGK